MADLKADLQNQLNGLKQNHILEAAISVFSEKGFHRAKIRDIAKAAGVADGTVYNYFSSKDDLLLGILNKLNETESRPAQFEALGQENLEALFQAQMKHRFSVMMANKRILQAVLPEVLSNAELRDLYFTKVILPTMTQGENAFSKVLATNKVSAMALVRAMAASLFGLVVLTLLGDKQSEESADEMIAFLAKSFARELEGNL
ncbi:MAG: TetR/AcrR family transcriptional regulator [Trueperaceae bacterium]|nr:TetR/AcrR family transcriptional regulator [Trueperaceae bacterium]